MIVIWVFVLSEPLIILFFSSSPFSIFFCLWYGHNDHSFLWVEENLSR